MPDSIRYIAREDIDNQKWNDCISKSPNGLVYAYTEYLDRMATQWSALVQGDYERVMPLPWRKKMGIHYLYRPAFTASLGIFGYDSDAKTTNAFINAIPAYFKLIEIDLNKSNQVVEGSVNFIKRTNYVLPLNKSYEALFAAYRDTTKRNIKKAEQLNFCYKKDIPVESVVEISKNQLAVGSSTTDKDFDNFISLFRFLYEQKKAVTRAICAESGEILASCVYFFSHNRIYYILVGNHPNGKTLGASHFLIDQFIKENASTELLLDFEGSDIKNLAFFYSSFGAEVETYPALHINRLPKWVKWLRRIRE